ncbi:hypothetical protein [Chryseobacterium populi]|uniref:Lipocalin-like domain-containing protein n=1 Tax=Chryseobacterium populi TaxID=1144316 RepID=J3CI51_9FLAO|nr:hypothetical protein [Chryseobacterium populi]EJL72054.1 hypothetical protein PMI13_02045 [Chryseobacterium populi]
MRILIVLLFYSLIVGCQGQTQNLTLADAPKNFRKNDNADYFTGTWKLTAKNYADGNEKKVFPLHECMKHYTLLFEKERQDLFLTKNFATGKNCTVKSSTSRNLITLNGSSFSYFEEDLKKNEQFKIISKNRFAILYTDIIYGKVTEIEDVYEKQ